MREEFHPMKLLWLGYLVYSLGNCVVKLCIETSLSVVVLVNMKTSVTLTTGHIIFILILHKSLLSSDTSGCTVDLTLLPPHIWKIVCIARTATGV